LLERWKKSAACGNTQQSGVGDNWGRKRIKSGRKVNIPRHVTAKRSTTHGRNTGEGTSLFEAGEGRGGCRVYPLQSGSIRSANPTMGRDSGQIRRKEGKGLYYGWV